METSGEPISVGIVSLGACAITEPERGLPAGGSELQLYLIARALAAQKDFRVTLHVADLGQAERVENGVRIRPLARLGPLRGASPESQGPVRSSGEPAKKSSAALRKVAAAAGVPRILRRLARSRHRIYVTRSASSITGMVRLASWLAGGRHLHMCAHDDECAGRADAALSRPAKWLHRFGLRHADVVTCQTESQREVLKSAQGLGSVLAPNLLPDIGGIARERGRAGALWVGRDVDWKQPEVFLELARRLPEHRFTMVCQPQPGRDFHRLAAAAPANVELIPGRPILETAGMFGLYRVFVLTSSAEGFPNVLLQAAHAGTPVVSLAVNPENVLTRHDAGRFCHGSVDELLQASRELLTDESAWERCHAGALELARIQAPAEGRIVAILRDAVKTSAVR